MNNAAEAVKAYREKNKISLRELAKAIGITHSALWRFEEDCEIEGSAWVKIMVWLITK